jgi:hypothetical protein
MARNLLLLLALGLLSVPGLAPPGGVDMIISVDTTTGQAGH